MKTTKFKKMKSFYLIMVMILFMGASCQTNNGKQKNSTTHTDTKTVKAPAMDIHAAAFMGDVNVLQQHIKAGTDLNKKDQYGSTPLHTAITFGKTEAAKLLILNGANLNIKNNDGSTPLHVAAFLCRTKVVKVLLLNGADKTMRNNYGSTALESASGPFEQVKPIYEQLNKDLGALGLKLDYKRLEKTRPEIALLLSE